MTFSKQIVLTQISMFPDWPKHVGRGQMAKLGIITHYIVTYNLHMHA